MFGFNINYLVVIMWVENRMVLMTMTLKMVINV
jgi:hypothetical protein